MDVALYGRHQDFRAGYPLSLSILFHIRLEEGYRFAHYLGGLDHLGEEHFSRAETLAYAGHSVHQRPFNELYRRPAGTQQFLEVSLQACAASRHEGPGNPLLRRDVLFLPGLGALAGGCRRPLGAHRRGQFEQPLARFRVGVENHVFDALEQLRLDAVVDLQHSGIDDAHIQARLDGVVEEDGMHRFAHGIVAPEGEGQVGDASGSQRSREIPLDPAHRLDEVDAVAGVLGDAGAHRKDVHVKYDVAAREACFAQELVRAAADSNLALIVGRLALLIKGHHHYSGTQGPDFPRLAQEGLLSLLEGD